MGVVRSMMIGDDDEGLRGWCEGDEESDVDGLMMLIMVRRGDDVDRR